MTTEPQEKNTKKSAPESICESCGAKFSCGARANQCWCFAVNLNAETLAVLKENFAGCVCAKCLSAPAENQTESGLSGLEK